MIAKVEINIVLGILNEVLKMIESIDPNAKENKTFIDVSKIIILLNKLLDD